MLVVLGFGLLLLLLVIGAGIVLFDLGRRREEDAEWLQTKIIESLHRDPVLSSLEILPVVHVPSDKHAPVSVSLSGEVSSEAARGALLDIVQEAARKRGREIRTDDRLAVRRAGTRAA